MTHWETMWKFNTANFAVSWQITDCVDPDLSWADDETKERLGNGFYAVFDSRVVVYCNGEEIGCDYLGESIYENPSDFRDHIGSRGKYGSYFTDMVKTAIGEARNNLRKIQTLKIRKG